jgi:DNA-binding PadR family transcriptional regulator
VDNHAAPWHGGAVPQLNATAAALLGLLQNGPMTGGQLVSSAGERFGGFFGVTRSQVYRELPALAEAGLVRLGKQGPRSSQQYAVTAAGRRAFRSWLSAPAEPDQMHSPLVLRLMHAGSLTPRQRADLVARSRRAYTARLDKARGAARVAGDRYTKAAADFAVAHNRAMLKLLDAIPTE